MTPTRWPLLLTLGIVLLTLAGCATEQHASRGASQTTHPANAQQAVSPFQGIGPQAQAGGGTNVAEQGPPKNLWQRLRRGFELQQETDRPQVHHWIKFYLSRRKTLQATLQRAEPFMWHIVQSIDHRNMPMELALLPAVESAFKPTAYSRSHAVGLWQFLPGTGRRFGLVDNWWYDGRRDVRSSTRAALDYLQYLDNLFQGNWTLAIAAYNAGGGRIQDAVAYNKAHGRPTDFWDLSLPQETASYVPKLLALAAIIAHPTRYGVKLPALPNKPLLKSVKLPGQVDLRLVAKLSGLPLKRVRDLNAGYKRWATAPDGPDHLLLPVSAAKRFEKKITKVPHKRLVTWRRHRVARGDTLSTIAHHYGTSVYLLKRINHLHGNLIRVGQNLVIPAGRERVSHYDVAQASHSTAPAHHTKTVAHRVRSGDTLWGVAHRYGVSVAQLARWNGLSKHATLHPGQKLRVLSGAKHGAAEPTKHSSRQYTVRRGDSLWGIAHQHGLSVAQLARWNGLSAKSALKPGETLRLSGRRGGQSAQHHTVYYTVKHGDSLWHIARLFQVNVQQLENWNNLDQNQYLQAGQRLKVVLNAST